MIFDFPFGGYYQRGVPSPPAGPGHRPIVATERMLFNSHALRHGIYLAKAGGLHALASLYEAQDAELRQAALQATSDWLFGFGENKRGTMIKKVPTAMVLLHRIAADRDTESDISQKIARKILTFLL